MPPVGYWPDGLVTAYLCYKLQQMASCLAQSRLREYSLVNKTLTILILPCVSVFWPWVLPEWGDSMARSLLLPVVQLALAGQFGSS